MATRPYAEDIRYDERKKRVLLFFVVIGLFTMIMGVGGFALYPGVGVPPGLITIGVPPSPSPSPDESPSPTPTPRPTATPTPYQSPSPSPVATPSWSPLPGGNPTPPPTPVPTPTPTPPPFGPPPPPVNVGLSQAGAWTLSLGGLVPGDTVSRLVTIDNSGSADLIGYQLNATSSTSNALTNDSVHGLHVRVERCSTAWVFGGSGSALAATCPGTLTTVVATSPVLGSHSLAGGAFCSSAQSSHPTSCTLTDTDHLRLTVSVPASAGNALEGLASNVTFTWSGSGG